MGGDRRFWVVAVIVITLIGRSEGRDIRPSEHGLEFQNESPSVAKSPELVTFFGNSASTASSSNDVPLPRAMNASDPSWLRGTKAGKGGDRVKEVLLVASLVCGITGVAFLVAAAFIFLFRFRKQESSSDK